MTALQIALILLSVPSHHNSFQFPSYPCCECRSTWLFALWLNRLCVYVLIHLIQFAIVTTYHATSDQSYCIKFALRGVETCFAASHAPNLIVSKQFIDLSCIQCVWSALCNSLHKVSNMDSCSAAHSVDILLSATRRIYSSDMWTSLPPTHPCSANRTSSFVLIWPAAKPCQG